MTTFIAESIQYLFLQIILYRITRLVKFFSICKLSLHRQLGFSSETSKIQVEKKTPLDSEPPRRQFSFSDRKVAEDGVVVIRDDVELVMRSLGIFTHPEGEKIPDRISSADLFNIFEEEQPRLDEVKGAFDVFDENKDGFIDAGELQRVLCALGLKDRADMDDCRKMIGVFDVNADGRIDFNEFVKFMESSFC